jgi:hypothetical protein
MQPRDDSYHLKEDGEAQPRGPRIEAPALRTAPLGQAARVARERERERARVGVKAKFQEWHDAGGA